MRRSRKVYRRGGKIEAEEAVSTEYGFGMGSWSRSMQIFSEVLLYRLPRERVGARVGTVVSSWRKASEMKIWQQTNRENSSGP